MLRLARLFLGKPDPLATAQARLHVAKEARADAKRRGDTRALNKADRELRAANHALMRLDLAKRGRAPRMEMAR